MLANCPNLRDFGGYETLDGGRVRRGMLYRAGTLSNLDDQDHEVIAGLGIRLICDLRQEDERMREPSRWCEPPVEVWTWSYGSLAGGLMAQLAAPGATEHEAAAGMVVFYVTLPRILGAAIRDIIAALAAGVAPVLIHCSAGKDRTGVVAGFLLAALGVSRPLILADYARSAKLMDYEAILHADPNSSLGLARGGTSIARLAPAVRARVLASDEAYLAAALADAERQAGSVEAFLTRELNVPAEVISRFRATLLE